MKEKSVFLKRVVFLALVLLVIFSSVVAQAATFCVSNEAELQAALTTAAGNGEDDTIKIVQGTYDGNFIYDSYEANSLTVEGGYTEECTSRTIDPANTVLDGGNLDMVLALVSNGAAGFSIEGLTLKNGKTSTSEHGGGLHAETEGNVNLTSNVFANNAACYSMSNGGGAYLCIRGNGSVTLLNNGFTNNEAYRTGGGIYILLLGNSIVTVNNNKVSNNSASGFIGGGGVYIHGDNEVVVSMTNNTFIDNVASYSESRGGGACIGCDSVTLTDNSFNGNTASGGAGICVSGAIVTLTNNIFTNNIALSNGGGAWVHYYADNIVTLSNNTFTENTATNGPGGGAYIAGRDVTLTNNTITANVAETEGGGVWLRLRDSDRGGALYNNIIWNNSAPEGADVYIDNIGDDPFFPVSVDLFNNDFDQNASGIYIAIPFAIDPSNLNNIDPLFVGGGNYHLTAESPCVNTGNNDAPDLPSTDKDGNPRIIGGIVDMGAYEYVNPIAEPATIDIDPDTLNLKSKGKWITCYIELCDGYDVEDIDVGTVAITSLKLNGGETVEVDMPAELFPTEIGDYNDNGILDFMVKFDRQLVQDVVPVGAIEITVSGSMIGEVDFQGTDTLLIIDKGREHIDDKNHGSVVY